MRMAFMGDVSEIRAEYELKLPFEVDIIFFNLEGPIYHGGTSSRNLPRKAGPRICSTRNVFKDFLSCADVCVGSIANNHGWDYGSVGITDTLEASREVGGHVVGLGEDCLRLEPNISVLAISEEVFGSMRLGGPLNTFHPRIFQTISAERDKGQFVVLLVHGGTEDTFLVRPATVSLYRSFCDAGACVVWGTHAHVPQMIESYKDSMICYGAGNAFVSLERWRDSLCGLVSKYLIYDSEDSAGTAQYLSSMYNEDHLMQLGELSDQATLEMIRKADAAMSRLLCDGDLHLHIWRLYAHVFYKKYFRRALRKGTLVDNLLEFLPIRRTGKLAYPLSIDSLNWPTNLDVIVTALAEVYELTGDYNVENEIVQGILTDLSAFV